jgi:hypothetical protein
MMKAIPFISRGSSLIKTQWLQKFHPLGLTAPCFSLLVFAIILSLFTTVTSPSAMQAVLEPCLAESPLRHSWPEEFNTRRYHAYESLNPRPRWLQGNARESNDYDSIESDEGFVDWHSSDSHEQYTVTDTVDDPWTDTISSFMKSFPQSGDSLPKLDKVSDLFTGWKSLHQNTERTVAVLDDRQPSQKCFRRALTARGLFDTLRQKVRVKTRGSGTRSSTRY